MCLSDQPEESLRQDVATAEREMQTTHSVQVWVRMCKSDSVCATHSERDVRQRIDSQRMLEIRTLISLRFSASLLLECVFTAVISVKMCRKRLIKETFNGIMSCSCNTEREGKRQRVAGADWHIRSESLLRVLLLLLPLLFSVFFSRQEEQLIDRPVLLLRLSTSPFLYSLLPPWFRLWSLVSLSSCHVPSFSLDPAPNAFLLHQIHKSLNSNTRHSDSVNNSSLWSRVIQSVSSQDIQIAANLSLNNKCTNDVAGVRRWLIFQNSGGRIR